jgi:cytochrome c oxidase subunit 1
MKLDGINVDNYDDTHAITRRTNYLNNGFTLKSWLLTRDHKRIAILYLISVSFFFFVGGTFAACIRLELLTPQTDLFTSSTYNHIFTAHGIIMVFLFLIPSIPATLGNFFIPLMIGAKDLAFPRINLLSWYLYMLGAGVAVWALMQGGVDTGWTFYAPYSTTFSNSYVVATGMGAFIIGFSSILTGLNFIVTVHTMRAPGMTWFRMPLFVWSMYATSLVMILGTPVIAITLLLLILERVGRVGIFDPAIGGDPILFQHLFWFYSHPAVYIMVLPGMGVISELIANMSRKRIFGYEFVAFSSIAIAVIGFLVWGHHLFVSGQSIYAGLVFSFLTMVVAIPSAVKVFNWTATLYKGSIRWDTPMIYALGFLGLFLDGEVVTVFVVFVSMIVCHKNLLQIQNLKYKIV